MGQTARTLWGAMRMPLWSFPVSYGHAFMFFSLYSGFTSYSIFTLYAMSHCMVGWCLMSPRYVERRVVVLAGYHVITISLGEVNKRFCQSTAVMQSVEGDCTDLFFLHGPARWSGFAQRPAHLVAYWICWTEPESWRLRMCLVVSRCVLKMLHLFANVAENR